MRNGTIFLSLIYTLVAIVGATNAYADFQVQEEFCTISNNFIGTTSDNEEYDGVINISFTTDGVVLPLINLSLSRNIEPTKVSLSWPDAKLLDSQQRPLFERSFQDRVAEETGKAFDMNKEGFVFYSKAYGFYRFQHFLALFLSQNNLTLTFVNANSNKTETQIVPLAGSDQAFREMLLKCHQSTVTNYINTDFSRKKPVFESWTNGYGISEFYIYENLLPEEAKYPNDISKILNQTSDISYKKLSEIHSLLVKKSELNTKVEEIATSTDYVTLRESIDENASKVLELSQNRDTLSGERGLIPTLELELAAIDSKITSTQSEIEVYKSQIDPLQERTEILKIRINELREQIAIYDQQIQQAQTNNELYKANLEKLDQILQKYAIEFAEANDAENDAEITEPLSTPFSMEEIDASVVKIDEQMKARRDLNKVLELIASISNFIQDLAQDHKEAFDLFTELSNLKVEKVRSTEALNNQELQKVQLLQIIGNISWETLAKYINKDKQDTSYQNKTNEEVITQVYDSIANKYDAHDAYVDELRQNRSNILAQVVCKSESFLRSFLGNCLSPLDMNDIKKVETYLDQLDSTELSELSSNALGRQTIIQRFESTLIDLLVKKISEELKEESQQKILESWQDAIYTRWKYRSIQNLNAAENFDVNYLTEILNLQKSEIRKIDEAKVELAKTADDLERKISTLNTQFVNKEAAYFASLTRNQNSILNEINRTSLDLAELNLECLLNITNVETCSSEVNLVSTESTTKLTTMNQEIKSAVTILVLAARKQATEIETSLARSLEQLDEATADKNEFLVSSDFETKNQTFQQAKTELQRQELRLRSLQEQRANAEQRRVQANIELRNARSNNQALVSEIEGLVTVMQPTLVKLRPICSEKNRFINELFQTETRIFSLLDLNKTPESMNSLCEIKF